MAAALPNITPLGRVTLEDGKGLTGVFDVRSQKFYLADLAPKINKQSGEQVVAHKQLADFARSLEKAEGDWIGFSVTGTTNGTALSLNSNSLNAERVDPNEEGPMWAKGVDGYAKVLVGEIEGKDSRWVPVGTAALEFGPSQDLTVFKLQERLEEQGLHEWVFDQPHLEGFGEGQKPSRPNADKQVRLGEEKFEEMGCYQRKDKPDGAAGRFLRFGTIFSDPNVPPAQISLPPTGSASILFQTVCQCKRREESGTLQIVIAEPSKDEDGEARCGLVSGDGVRPFDIVEVRKPFEIQVQVWLRWRGEGWYEFDFSSKEEAKAFDDAFRTSKRLEPRRRGRGLILPRRFEA